MSEKAVKECVVCADTIPQKAAKCRHCGSFQNFRRHFDFGNTALALLVALVSVSTTAGAGIYSIYRSASFDPLAPEVYASVLDIDLTKITLLFSNVGPSRLFLKRSALCRVPIVKPGVDLITNDSSLIRYPRPSEVAFVEVLSFYDEAAAGEFLEGGKASTLVASMGQMRPEPGRPFNELIDEVKGYCFVSYLTVDNREDGTFLMLDPVAGRSLSLALSQLPPDELSTQRAHR